MDASEPPREGTHAVPQSVLPQPAQPPQDRLADLFARQADLAAFYARVRPDGFYGSPPMERCGMWVRAIIHECCELEDELGWKPWKNAPDVAATREARLAETVDILHFVLQLALDQGFDANDIYAAYLRKNAENRARQSDDPRYRAE